MGALSSAGGVASQFGRCQRGYVQSSRGAPGLAECWGDTIIPFPFCDGYENRDRTWGIIGASADDISSFPLMLDEYGHVAANKMQQTNIDRL